MKESKTGVSEETKNQSYLMMNQGKGCLDRADRVVENIGSAILTVLFLIMTLVAIMQVISRYVLAISLSWSEELVIFLFIWTSWLGAGVAAARGMHIEINIFSFALEKKSPDQREKIEHRIRLIGTALIIIFLFYYCYRSFVYLQNTRMLDQYSTAMEINMLWPMSAILAGGILMLFHYLMRFVRDLKAFPTKKITKNSEGRDNL